MAIKIPKLKKREQIIAGVVIVVGIWAWWKYLYSPVSQDLAKLKTDLAQKESDVAKYKPREAELPKLKEAFENVKNQMKEAEKKLPTSKDIPNLLRTITDIMKKHGVNIFTINPKPLSPKDFYSEFPISVQANATYHTLAQFLTEIGQIERIINVVNLSITPKAASENDPTTISVTFDFITYVAK